MSGFGRLLFGANAQGDSGRHSIDPPKRDSNMNPYVQQVDEEIDLDRESASTGKQTYNLSIVNVSQMEIQNDSLVGSDLRYGNQNHGQNPKTLLYEEIQRHNYVPIRNEMLFRREQSPDDLKNRLLLLLILLGVCYFIPAKSPKEKLDR